MRLPTTTLSLLAIAPAAAAAAGERTYTDDLGVVHTTTKEKPTIVTFAHTAVSAFDYGLGTDQLIGTYGEYLVEGSTFDFDMPEQASAYSADPEPDDIARLLETTNLSPDCERTPGYCTAFDVAGLVELDPDFLVVHGYAGRPWGFSNFTEIQLNFPEERIIFNDVSLEGDNCTATENCYGKSMIGMVEQYRELGAFLGVEEGPELQADFADLCEAANEFSAHMEAAHEKGIRTMASYVDPTSGFYASPVNDMVLRMFEELGMPILHIGSCANCSLSYFWETIPVESYFKSCEVNTTDFSVCNEDPLYPIDVWLYDHRVRGTVNNEDFGVVFPDKAILAGQFVEWPIGGRKITPAHAAEILRSVGPAVAGFDRIHGETDCVPDIDVSGLDHRKSGEGVKGAGAGQYACFNSDFHNQKYFQGCADVAASDAGEKGNTDDHDHSEHDHGDEEKETDEPAVEADEPTVEPDKSDSSASRSSALAALAVAALTMVYGM